MNVTTNTTATTLHIHNTTTHDAGTYRCELMYSTDDNSIDYFYLNVTNQTRSKTSFMQEHSNESTYDLGKILKY